MALAASPPRRQRIRLASTALPNINVTKISLLFNGPDRTGTYGTLSGKIFFISGPGCTSPMATTATIVAYSGASKTINDADAISGC